MSGGKHGRAVWFRMHYPRPDGAFTVQVVAPSGLPLRVPGAQESHLPALGRKPYVPKRVAVGPEVLKRVHAALMRL